MPIYEYECVDCHRKQKMIGSIDDRVALCACGGLALRVDTLDQVIGSLSQVNLSQADGASPTLAPTPAKSI